MAIPQDDRIHGLPVEDDAWDGFLYNHCDAQGAPKNAGWQFWKGEFDAKRPVPVFWLPDPANPARVATLGMAMTFKLAYPLTTRALLGHSDPAHLIPLEAARADMPSLIFGQAAEADDGRGLKRRAWFGLGRCTTTPLPQSLTRPAAILNSPKPDYAGIYVRQREAQGDQLRHRADPGEPMAVYAPLPPNTPLDPAANRRLLDEPELAGVKIWPSSRDHGAQVDVNLPPPPAGTAPPGPGVKTILHPLPAGTTFTVPLTFHNLRKVELGALLWALTFRDPRGYGQEGGTGGRKRHRLGMGKPYGLGEVELTVTGLILEDVESPATVAELLKAFVDHMTQVYPRPNGWPNSPQVKALLKAADPGRNAGSDLGYMSVKDGDDSYVNNRNAGRIMGGYADSAAHEIARPVAPGQGVPPEAQDSDAAEALQAERGPVAIGDRVRIHAKATNGGQEGTVTFVPGNPLTGEYGIKGNGWFRKYHRSLFDPL